MAERHCEFVFEHGDCCRPAELLDGQRLFCAQHHAALIRKSASYAARVSAYNADRELVAARAAYRAAKDAAESAHRAAWLAKPPVEIPLEERTSIRVFGLDDISAGGVRELCLPFGYVHGVGKVASATADKPSCVRISFLTHEEAADTLSGIASDTVKTEWVSMVLAGSPPPLYGVDRLPDVATAKARLHEQMRAARERQQPGILAKEAAEDNEAAAERAAEEAEEARERAREDAYEAEEHRRRWAEDEKDIVYARARNAAGIPGPHVRAARRRQFEDEERNGGW